MQFGNFNITFGEKEEPMLDYFDSIIYPAMTANLSRGKKEKNEKVYYFNNINLAKDAEGEYILVGNFIKDFDFEINSKIVNGELVQVKEYHPDAPFSRFIIFLKNHRMVLIKNESSSPDLKSFAATVRDVIFQYTKSQNSIRREQHLPLLPNALINIVGIPMENSIKKALETVESIKYLHLRVYPLNGDRDYNPLIDRILEVEKDTTSKSALLTISSPKSKRDVVDLISSVGGIVEPKLDVKFIDKSRGSIKPDKLTETLQVDVKGLLNDGNDDNNIIILVKTKEIMTKVTNEGLEIYSKAVVKLEELFNKLKK